MLAAFGLSGPVRALAGGTGTSVLAGSAVVKPVADPEEAEWTAATMERVSDAVDLAGETGGGAPFRVPRPLRAADGRFVVAGWTASRLVAGEPGPVGRWAELLAAARGFHRALRDEPRPALLDRPRHRWALADRVAWQEAAIDPLPQVLTRLRRLLELYRPLSPHPAQLVHGDLSGNVLFAPGLPPAVIDFSPYWRPVGWAEAVVVADGLLWYGAGPDLVDLVRARPAWPQLLARALVFRLVALNEVARADAGALAELPAYDRATDVVERADRLRRPD